MRRLVPLALILFATACSQSMSAAGEGGSRRNGPIELTEIRKAGAPDAHTLVESLRPRWLRSARQQTLSGNDALVVYLGRARMGGVNELRSISVADIGRVEYLSPAVAQQRFGRGHLNGAIVLHPLMP